MSSISNSGSYRLVRRITMASTDVSASTSGRASLERQSRAPEWIMPGYMTWHVFAMHVNREAKQIAQVVYGQEMDYHTVATTRFPVDCTEISNHP